MERCTSLIGELGLHLRIRTPSHTKQTGVWYNCKPTNQYLVQRDVNFLGVTINEHIDWSPNINKLSNKILRTLGVA